MQHSLRTGLERTFPFFLGYVLEDNTKQRKQKSKDEPIRLGSIQKGHICAYKFLPCLPFPYRLTDSQPSNSAFQFMLKQATKGVHSVMCRYC